MFDGKVMALEVECSTSRSTLDFVRKGYFVF